MFSKRKVAIVSLFLFMTISVFSSDFSYIMENVLASSIGNVLTSMDNGKAADDKDSSGKEEDDVAVVTYSSGVAAYVEGCKLYSDGDWVSATMMLKKAASYDENFRPDVYYMLITAEVYAGDKKNALDDCNVFLSSFPDSSLCSRVKYHKGKLLYDLEEYDKAIIELSDFCHQYVDDELYSHSLYYIGESLFAGYRYEEAQGIFERIVNEFPESDKVPAARYRIDTILQRNREEKLLYLLKQTGEEYLSAKEEYEKQLKMYNSETVNATRKKLSDALSKNSILEKQVADLQSQLDTAKSEIKKVEAERDAAVDRYNELSAVHEQYVPAVSVIEGSNARPTAKEEVENDGVAEIGETDVEKNIISVPDSKTETVKDVSAADNHLSESEIMNGNGKGDFDNDIPSLVPYDETQRQLRILKEKAREVQKIFDLKNGNRK